MQQTPTRRGRQPDANSKSGQIRELLATGMTPAEIAKKLSCTPALIYNVRARMAGGGPANRPVPGRPVKPASTGTSGLDGFLDAVKNSERERTQLRAALEKIQAVIADVLG